MPQKATNWSANHLKFIEWLALPSKQRNPKTQTLLAKEMGVDRATLSDWKRLPGLMEEVAAISRAMLKDSLSDVYGALAKKAADGDVSAMKLFLEMAGEYIAKSEINNSGEMTIRVVRDANSRNTSPAVIPETD